MRLADEQKARSIPNRCDRGRLAGAILPLGSPRGTCRISVNSRRQAWAASSSISMHWDDTKWFALSVRGHGSLYGGVDGSAAWSGGARLGPSASSPAGPRSDHAAWWAKSIPHISGPGRDFDSWGSGHGGGSPSVKCQLVARLPDWAGAICLCLLRKLACSRVCPQDVAPGRGVSSREASAGSGVSRCTAVFAAPAFRQEAP